ncbi:MAG: hypothetical protein J6B50_11320 [Lachnospiraceae bacterium]|nr:hypothetical protein [Lachnospiraceae bacterium]MBP3595255.1 hypothetical protein [Lachnospiraceae bacterium]
MKLWIVLDEKINKLDIKNGDSVFLSSVRKEQINSGIKAYYFDIFFNSEDEKLANSVNDLFTTIPSKWHVMKNTCYNLIFLPVISVIHQLDDIIEKNRICEIVLVGGSMHPFFTMTKGDGEGEKKLYKSNWLFNYFIYLYFSTNNKLKLTWVKKHKKINFIILQYFREIMFFVRGCVAELSRYLRNVKKDSVETESLNQAAIPVKLNLQMRHMNQLLENQNVINPVYLVPANISIDDDISGDYIKLRPCNVKELYIVIKESISCGKVCKKGAFYYGDFKFEIPMMALIRAMVPEYFRESCFTYQVEKIIKEQKNIVYLLTDFTYGVALKKLHEFAHEADLKHYNFQYVSMQKVLLPDLKLADRYYLHTKSTYDLYKKYNSSYLFYMPVIRTDDMVHGDRVNVVTFFLQPDKYAMRYYNILTELLDEIQKRDISLKVIIKPHYRQNMLEIFEKLAKSYEFCSLAMKDESVAELLDNSDIMLSMTSSVLFESVMRNVPGIIMDIDGQDEELINNNDSFLKEVNYRAKSCEEILEIFADISSFKKTYSMRRNVYLKQFDNVGITNEVFNA